MSRSIASLGLIVLLVGCTSATPPIGQAQPSPSIVAQKPQKTVEAKGFKFEIANYDTTESIQPPGSQSALTAPGGKLVLVYYRVTNIGKKTERALEIPLALRDSQGREYTAVGDTPDRVEIKIFVQWLQSQSLGGTTDFQYPGQTIGTGAIFKVPKDAEGLYGVIDGQPIEMVQVPALP